MTKYNFNCVAILVNDVYVGNKDTLEEAMSAGKSYAYYGGRVTFRRAERVTSKECMRTDVCFPNVNHPQYKESIVYADGTPLILSSV